MEDYYGQAMLIRDQTQYIVKSRAVNYDGHREAGTDRTGYMSAGKGIYGADETAAERSAPGRPCRPREIYVGFVLWVRHYQY